MVEDVCKIRSSLDSVHNRSGCHFLSTAGGEPIRPGDKEEGADCVVGTSCVFNCVQL